LLIRPFVNNAFGSAVAVSGDIVVVGAPYEDSSATGVSGNQNDNSASFSGAAYVFARSGSTWAQLAYLKASNTGASDWFGCAVAVSGGSVVVGAHNEGSNATGVGGNQADNSAAQAGATYVFALPAQEFWRQTWFGSPANSGNGADFHDYDRDGLVNLLEWACNLDPTTASTRQETTVLNGAILKYTYTRSVAAVTAGALFGVEWSDTLAAGSWSASEVTQTVLSDNGTLQQVQATLPAGSTGHLFVRLKVTGPP
jgi:hypothetical protein